MSQKIYHIFHLRSFKLSIETLKLQNIRSTESFTIENTFHGSKVAY